MRSGSRLPVVREPLMSPVSPTPVAPPGDGRAKTYVAFSSLGPVAHDGGGHMLSVQPFAPEGWTASGRIFTHGNQPLHVCFGKPHRRTAARGLRNHCTSRPRRAFTNPPPTSIPDSMTKPPLTLYLAAPRGFCAGVDRAIKIVEMALQKWGAPV